MLRSFLSAKAGWFVGVLALVIHAHADFAFTRSYFRGIAALASWVGIVIFPVWLIALLPLYLLIPRRSVLWRPWLCAACGAIAGAVILFVLAWWSFCVYGRASLADALRLPFLYVGPIIGATTCICGSILKRREII